MVSWNLKTDEGALQDWGADPYKLHELWHGQRQGFASGLGHPQYQYKLSAEWIESISTEDLGMLVGANLANIWCSPDSQLYPGLHHRRWDQQIQGVDSSSELNWGILRTRMTDLWEPQKLPEDWNTSPVRKVSQLGMFSLHKRRL